MSAAQLILRIVFFPVILVTLGTIGVFGFTVMEPFHAGVGEPPTGLGWGSPGATILTFASAGVIGLMLTLAIWFVVAPIREDRRQQFR